jgi:hypothetical protein
MDERTVGGRFSVPRQTAEKRGVKWPPVKVIDDFVHDGRVTIVNNAVSVEVIHHLVFGILVNKNIRRASPDVPAVADVSDGLVVVGRVWTRRPDPTEEPPRKP